MDKLVFNHKVENTGENNFDEIKNIDYPFDRYLIKVIVSQSNEFLGIEEITENKDFRSFKQKLRRQKYHDDINQYLED